MGRMHAPGKGISASAIVSDYSFGVRVKSISAIPPYRSLMAKANRRGDQGRHLQARQEGLQAIIDWCSSS